MNRRRTDHAFQGARLWLWPLMLAWAAVGFVGLRHAHFGEASPAPAYTEADRGRCPAPDESGNRLFGQAAVQAQPGSPGS